MKKRGQITVFIIFGLIFLLFFLIILFTKSYRIEKIGAVSSGELNPIKNYVDLCAKSSASDSLYLLGVQGGYTAPPKLYFQSAYAKIAYSLLRIAGYKKERKLLDPFCSSGIIPMEAALYNKGAVNYYRKDDFAFLKLKPFEKNDFQSFFDKLNKKDNKNKPFIAASDQQLYHIRSAKKNAKIAAVNKDIEFSRADLEWLDTRFDKNEIDFIATKPMFSKYDLKRTKKTYDEFFYAAKYILSGKGKIALISRSMDLLKESAEKHGFKVTDERTVWQGQQKLNITIFIK